VSDKKFAIETEADIGKGFETLDGELGDLKKKTDDLVAKIEASENVIDDVAELGKDLKTLREDFAKASSKLVTNDGQATTPLPCSKAEFERSGYKALMGGRTKFSVHPTTREIETGDDPFAELQKAHDELLIYTATQSAINGRRPVNPRNTPYYAEKYAPALERAESMLKTSITITDDPADVFSWIETGMSQQLEDLVASSYRVLSFIRRVSIPRSPFDWPRRAGRSTLYRKTEEIIAAQGDTTRNTTGATAQDAWGTTELSAKATFTGETIAGVATLTDEADQDSIFMMVPLLRDELAESYARAQEDICINGDTAGTQDSDTTATTDHLIAADGFRLFGLAASTALSGGGAALDSMANWGSYVRDQIAKMGGYGDLNQFGNVPDDLLMIVSGKTFNQLLKIPEFMQLNTAGALATIGGVNANVAFRPNGLNLIVSDFVRDDVNASGVYDGVTTDLTTSLIVNKNAWVMGEFRAPRIQVFTDSYFRLWGQTGIMIDGRLDLQAVKDPTAASQTHTVITYNLDA
jgi:HK97 family phage major capsid protein